MTDLGEIMSARRAALEASSPPNGDAGGVEVIPPAESGAGESPSVVAIPAGDAGGPSTGVLPADVEPQFPINPPKVLGGLPYARSYMKLAMTIHSTDMVPKAFRDNPAALMAAFMYGNELGMGPMQAANGIHVIDGKAGLYAEAMRALILEQGHIFVVEQGIEDTEPYAVVYCRRKDWPDIIPTQQFRWDLERGRRAGLVEWFEKWTSSESGRRRKLTWNPHSGEPEPAWVNPERGTPAEFKQSDAWRNYPESMCGARATSEAARANFADVIAGMSYTPEELVQFNGGTEEVPQSQPTPITDAGGQSALTTPPSPDSADETTTAPVQQDPPRKAKGTTKKAAPVKTGAPEAIEESEWNRQVQRATPTDQRTPEAIEEHIGGTTTDPSVSTETDQATPESPARTPDTLTPANRDPSLSSSTSQPGPSSSTQPSILTDGEDGASSSETSQPDALAGDGEIGIRRELLGALNDLLGRKNEAEQSTIKAFLGTHFPGMKRENLNAEELTLAVNIVAGWPVSADIYPAPERTDA